MYTETEFMDMSLASRLDKLKSEVKEFKFDYFIMKISKKSSGAKLK